jgi:hypothetical protein
LRKSSVESIELDYTGFFAAGEKNLRQWAARQAKTRERRLTAPQGGLQCCKLAKKRFAPAL